MLACLSGHVIFCQSINIWCQLGRAATIAMAERHADGSLPIEDFNIELEDQSGSKVNLGSETDQRYDMC